MGNLCKHKLNKNNNITILEEDGRLKKILSPKEIQFWARLRDLELTKISQIKNKAIYFNFSDLIYENFISLGAMMNSLVVNENFFLFNDLFEMTLAMIDFMQIIFYLKKIYELEHFFFINFNKFSLMRELNKNLFTKLIYLDHKLIDYYNSPEIVVKEDTNLFSSFSFVNSVHTYKNLIATSSSTKQSMNASSNKTGISTNLNTIYDNTLSNPNNPYEEIGYSMDMNSYFYSKCNERYRKLRENYSLDNCEYFYTECFITFLVKFLIKKTIICDSRLSHDFQNFKNKLKATLSFFLRHYNNKISLQKLKEILTNIYLNNYEYNLFRDKCEKLIINRDASNIALYDKILLQESLCIRLIYGECDISSDLSKHNLSYIYDYTFKDDENSVLKFIELKHKKIDNNVHIGANECNSKIFESLQEDVEGKYDWDNRSNGENKNRKSRGLGKLKKNNNSLSSSNLNFQNLNYNECEPLNRSSLMKKKFVKNKAEGFDKSTICLNCSKKIFLNNLPTEASSMIVLNEYNQDHLEKKYPNFALENVLNYFCYFFSVENIKEHLANNNNNIGQKARRKESLSSKSLNASASSVIESNRIEKLEVFNNKIYLKEYKNFYVYKKGELIISFIYNHISNKKQNIVLNLDEYAINLKANKKF